MNDKINNKNSEFEDDALFDGNSHGTTKTVTTSTTKSNSSHSSKGARERKQCNSCRLVAKLFVKSCIAVALPTHCAVTNAAAATAVAIMPIHCLAVDCCRKLCHRRLWPSLFQSHASMLLASF